jgi:hypothetical protein
MSEEAYLYIGCCIPFWLQYLLWLDEVCGITLWISSSSPHTSTFSSKINLMNYYSIMGIEFLKNNKSRYKVIEKNYLHILRCVSVVLIEGNLWTILFWCLVNLTYPTRAPTCNQGHIYLLWPNFCMDILKTWYLVKLQQLTLSRRIHRVSKKNHLIYLVWTRCICHDKTRILPWMTGNKYWSSC